MSSSAKTKLKPHHYWPFVREMPGKQAQFKFWQRPDCRCSIPRHCVEPQHNYSGIRPKKVLVNRYRQIFHPVSWHITQISVCLIHGVAYVCRPSSSSANYERASRSPLVSALSRCLSHGASADASSQGDPGFLFPGRLGPSRAPC